MTRFRTRVFAVSSDSIELSPREQALTVGVFALLLVTLFFAHLAQGSLRVDAIRYAMLALELTETGDFWNYTDPYSGSPYVNKPPLLFWLTAGSLELYGRSTFAAKAPAVLPLLLFLGFLLSFLRRWGYSLSFGVLVALAFSLTPTFFQDALDLSLEGLVLLGLLLCLGGSHSKSLGFRNHFAAVFVGSLILALTKPPYLLLVIAAVGLSEVIFRRRMIPLRALSFVPALLVGGAWFSLIGMSLSGVALENQLVKPTQLRAGVFVNLLDWTKILLVQYLPFNALVLFVIWKKKLWAQFKSPAGIVVLLNIAILPFLDSRPRYFYPAATALALIACSAPIDFTLRRVTRCLVLLFCLLTWVIFLVRPLPAHRENPFHKGLVERPELFTVSSTRETVLCVEDARAEKQEGLETRTRLLVEFYSGKEFAVLSPSSNLPARGWLIADRRCDESLQKASPSGWRRQELEGLKLTLWQSG